MEPAEWLQLYVDTICGHADDGERRPGEPFPGFARRDFALLWSMIFWPLVLSAALICLIVIHAVTAS